MFKLWILPNFIQKVKEHIMFETRYWPRSWYANNKLECSDVTLTLADRPHPVSMPWSPVKGKQQKVLGHFLWTSKYLALKFFCWIRSSAQTKNTYTTWPYAPEPTGTKLVYFARTSQSVLLSSILWNPGRRAPGGINSAICDATCVNYTNPV